MYKLILPFIFLLFENGFSQTNSFYLNEAATPIFLFSDQNIYITTGANFNKLIKTDYSGNVIWVKEGRFSPFAVDDQSIYSIFWDSAYTSMGIVKMDTSGTNIWAKDLSNSIYPLSSGNKNAVGSTALSGNRIYISSSQYDSISFEGEYGGIITIDTSGNYINSWCDTLNYGGYISKSITANNGAWIVSRYPGVGYEEGLSKLNATGNFDTSAYSSYLDIGVSILTYDIVKMPDSCYLVYSYVNPGGLGSFPSDNKIFIMKLHENGAVAWTKTIESQSFSDTAYIPDVATCDSLGNIYLIGSVATNFGNDGYKISVKLDSSGNFLFTKKWDLPPFSIKQLCFKDNHLYCGITLNPNFYPGILVLDTMLNACGVNYSLTTVPYVIDSIPIVLQNSIVSRPYNLLNDNIQVSIVNNPISLDLCLALKTEIQENEKSIQVSPNPFKNSITISFKSHSEFKLILFNLMGEEILEKKISGEEESIDLSGLISGVYIISLTGETGTLIRKIVKI